MTGLVVMLALCLSAPEARAESLRSALQRTLSLNPTINAEREKLRAIDETIGIAGANFRPNVTLNGDVTRENLYTDFGKSGATDDTYTSRGYSLNISQPLYRGGRTVAALNEADANILAAREGLRNVEQSTLLDVATTYISLVRDRAIKRLRENNLRLLGKQLEATIARQRAGVVTETDVAQALSRKSSAQSDVALADANLRTNIAEYIRITSRAPSGLHFPVLRKRQPVANLAQAIRVGKSQNPAILAARYARDAAKFRIDLVRGERLPEFTLEAGFAQRWDITKTIEERRTANIRLRGSIPLYQGGSVGARIRQGQATLRQNSLQISAAVALARSQAVSSWGNLIVGRSRIKSAKVQIKAAEKALFGVQNEERVGQRTVLDVLNAEEEVLNAKVVMQQAKSDHIIAYFRLLSAMGRLTLQSASY
ncbi:MAG: TolC family outer membrane protein [Hyphomicrobiaceae bacterium]|nr:TolC family outer membrane protein [Hyphomicrobiaceae bacterium]